MALKLVVGVDGGGTKTAACLLRVVESDGSNNDNNSDLLKQAIETANANRVLSGSTNWNSVGDATAKQHLFEAFDKLLRLPTHQEEEEDGDAARSPPSATVEILPVTHFVLGMSCVDTAKDKTKLCAWIDEYLSKRRRQRATDGEHGSALVEKWVYGDAVIALASGTAGVLHGCNLIAGTGVIAYGRNKLNGKEARAAGYGPALGDGGSGFHIGEMLLKAVVQISDGRLELSEDSNETSDNKYNLTKLVLDALQLEKVEDLLSWAYGGDGQEAASWDKVASLAPIVFDLDRQRHHQLTSNAAAAADNSTSSFTIAAAILDDAVSCMAQNIVAVLSRLELTSSSSTSASAPCFPIVLSGGVASQPEIPAMLTAALTRKMQEKKLHCIAFELRSPTVNPEIAAALLAVQRGNDQNSVQLL